MNQTSRVFTRLVSVITMGLLFVLTGCGSGNSADDPVVIGMTDAVIDLNDAAPEKFKAQFAKAGAVPDDAKIEEMKKLYFNPIRRTIKRKGDTATLMVKVTKDGVVTEMEWTLAKEGDSWKILNYTLP